MFSDMEFVGEIGVCIDCMIADQHGDISPDRPADLPGVWSEYGIGYMFFSGGEHSDSCPNLAAGDGDTSVECDCDDIGFTWTSCDACGDSNGGDRFKYSVYRWTLPAARTRFDHAMTAARHAIPRARRIAALEDAAAIRGYMRDRFTADARFARWAAHVAA